MMLSWLSGSSTDNQKCTSTKENIKFSIQGEEHVVDARDIGPETTLNDYIRQKLCLPGTKRMCFEGGCGACVVGVTRDGDDKVMAVNSCLISILSCHGWKIDTIEGIGNSGTTYHPVQKALVNFNGTQCGFCSPGMIMNMYALCKDGKPTMKDVENSFGGNICRCTGYRPILTAFKSLCSDVSSELLGTYPDIEDFCTPHSEEIMQKLENLNTNSDQVRKSVQPIMFENNESTWIKVFTLKDLLSTLDKEGNRPYMLVGGNTAKGVYQLPIPSTYIDILDVKELTTYVLQNDLLLLGASISLSETMSLFFKIAKANPKFAHLKTMAEHIDLIAHVPVRNMGTVAGNLMIKHSHNEFPSDIFLILETFMCKLIIIDTTGNEVIKTLPEFLNCDMTKKIIKTIQIPSLSNDYHYETYKIMPRAQNAHALVNAGILFQLDQNNKVENARIVFGNINPKFIHATKTEEFLKGKQLFDNNTLQGAFKTLSEELVPEAVLPEPDPEFRKQLGISLLYKGILSMAPDTKLSPKVKSGATKLIRPVSTGSQDYETNKSLYPLTQPITKLEAEAQSSGEAQYIDDIPDLPHQLYGKLVLAKAPPTSTILHIDASKALATKGIVSFLTKDDIPGENNFLPAELSPLPTVERIFCDKIVQYYEQPIGMLVGKDMQVLSKAVDLVEVKYDPPKRNPLLSIREILKANASDKLIQEHKEEPKKIGDDIKHTLTGQFNLYGQYHFHMELQCTLAIPTEDGLQMYPSTQWMDLIQIATAKMLKIPHNKIQISVRRCGGAFGAKISRNAQISCAAALAAWKLKKPVRMALSLKENMGIIGKRFPFSADYEVQVNDSGVIQHLKSKMYGDHGVGGNENFAYLLIFDMIKGHYATDSYDSVYYRAVTDTPANTWMRAPGSLEGFSYIESIMDHIAYELNMDPLQVRINNISETSSKILDYIKDLKEWANIDERKQSIIDFNKNNRWKKKGISIAPMSWDFFIMGPLYATVSIYHVDGSVTISHGGIEIGQGVNTKAAQVCAYIFNIPLEKVNVVPSNSVISANSLFTGASWTSEAICYSIITACEDLLLRLKPYRKEPQTWEELIKAAFAEYVILTANAQYTPNSPSVNKYFVYGVGAAEVEVDILTGQYQISRVDLIEDVGTSMSPLIDIGQVEGAFVMGLGYHTTEKLVFSKDGKMLTNNTWYYKPPGAKDIPIDFRIKLPKNNPNPLGVLQSKAVGEPPLMLSLSVPLAIRNAVASARTDADPSKPKYFGFDGPTTVENTFMNTLNDYKQYTLK